MQTTSCAAGGGVGGAAAAPRKPGPSCSAQGCFNCILAVCNSVQNTSLSSARPPPFNTQRGGQRKRNAGRSSPTGAARGRKGEFTARRDRWIGLIVVVATRGGEGALKLGRAAPSSSQISSAGAGHRGASVPGEHQRSEHHTMHLPAWAERGPAAVETRRIFICRSPAASRSPLHRRNCTPAPPFAVLPHRPSQRNVVTAAAVDGAKSQKQTPAV
jgi:hypothetical protein